ncbi:MAG: arylsulfatase [Pseudomonadota bacterium]
MKVTQWLAAVFALLVIAWSTGVPAQQHNQEQPNVLLVVADDLGYSDLGVFGSEIATPHIDALASDSVVFTNFHANATCTPSRAMLLTGIDNHTVGYGANPIVAKRFPAIRGKPAYRGEFTDGTRLLAQYFAEAGYATSMAGKWHLGRNPDSWPPARGYERSYFFENGGASHFADRMGNLDIESPVEYWEGEKPAPALPEDFYSTTFYTDKLIAYIEAGVESGRPFFAHLSYTAPHWPLQAPDGWRDRYSGAYDQGWATVRSKRIARMIEIGLLDEATPVSPLPDQLGDWSELTDAQKRSEARRMELYAAMVSHLDQEFGRLVKFLKDIGEYNNTIIVLLSDNGPEGNDVMALRNNSDWVPQNFDLSYENMGRSGSYVWQGRSWAHVSATPLRLYKSFLSEGGIRVPAIMKLPGSKEARQHRQFASVMDIAPTLLEAARIPLGEGEQMMGVSLLTSPVKGEEQGAARAVAMEIYGGKVVFEGRWKLMWAWPPFGEGEWKLYDIEKDPGETQDLSAQNTAIVSRLATVWYQYIKANGIYEADHDFGYGRYPDQLGRTSAEKTASGNGR